MAKRAALLIVLAVLSGGLVACGDDDGGSAGSGQDGTQSSQSGDGGGADRNQSPRQGYGADGGDGSGQGGDRPSVETIVVRGGAPVDGVRELEFDAGSTVAFRVRSDVGDEVHVHGYELSKDVQPGGTVAFSFPADIEGIFEVELEGRHQQIAELRVNP